MWGLGVAGPLMGEGRLCVHAPGDPAGSGLGSVSAEKLGGPDLPKVVKQDWVWAAGFHGLCALSAREDALAGWVASPLPPTQNYWPCYQPQETLDAGIEPAKQGPGPRPGCVGSPAAPGADGAWQGAVRGWEDVVWAPAPQG